MGAGGGCLDIFTLIYPFLSSFSLSLGDGPIWTEILSQRAVKPKTNQPTYCKSSRPLPYCNPIRTPRHWKFTQHHRNTRPPLPSEKMTNSHATPLPLPSKPPPLIKRSMGLFKKAGARQNTYNIYTVTLLSFL